MSLNDRASEALEIIRHGGRFDTSETRELLEEVLAEARAGIRFPDGLRDAARSIRDANPGLAQHAWDGEWHSEHGPQR